MSRMHPGKPPSQRRSSGWSSDSKGRIRTATRSLAAKLRESFDYGDSTNRKIIVQSVRIAIGGDSQPSIEAVADAEDGEGYATILGTTAAVYRVVLDRLGLDRNDPVMAESFMGEVVKALDEEMGMGWRPRVRKLAGLLAYNLRDKNDANQVRRKITDAVREALGEKPTGEMSKLVTFSARDGEPAESSEGLTTAGCFRAILDNEPLDRRDPAVADDFMAESLAGIDDGLSVPLN